MIRDITIGQYYPADSVLHKLDPRVKLGGTMIFLISLFLTESVCGYILATIFLAGLIRLSKVPFKFIIRGLKAIFIILAFSVIFNIFLTSGEVIAEFWIFKITKEGLATAAMMYIRFVFIIFCS